MVKPFLIYWKWHYWIAPRDLLRIWRNFLIFGLHFFSIPLLLRTLFWPWRRDIEEYPRGFDFKVYFRIFVGNLISRVIGAIVKLTIIIIGVIAELFIFVIGLFVFISWWFLPLLIICGIISGIFLML